MGRQGSHRGAAKFLTLAHDWTQAARGLEGWPVQPNRAASLLPLAAVRPVQPLHYSGKDEPTLSGREQPRFMSRVRICFRGLLCSPFSALG